MMNPLNLQVIIYKVSMYLALHISPVTEADLGDNLHLPMSN